MSHRERMGGEPICPHCGQVYSDPWETFDIANSGQRERLECGCCEQPFWAELRVTVVFVTDAVAAPRLGGEACCT